jgi:hypothetical protein
VWSAVDVDSKELLALEASYGRSSLNAPSFLKKALRMCTDKPLVLVDKGPWYRWAFERLGLEYRHERLGMRNRVERFFRYLKERTTVFHREMSAGNHIQGIRIKNLKLFLSLFTLYYQAASQEVGEKAYPDTIERKNNGLGKTHGNGVKALRGMFYVAKHTRTTTDDPLVDETHRTLQCYADRLAIRIHEKVMELPLYSMAVERLGLKGGDTSIHHLPRHHPLQNIV